VGKVYITLQQIYSRNGRSMPNFVRIAWAL